MMSQPVIKLLNLPVAAPAAPVLASADVAAAPEADAGFAAVAEAGEGSPLLLLLLPLLPCGATAAAADRPIGTGPAARMWSIRVPAAVARTEIVLSPRLM
jgi:hypothetical protein